MGFSKSAVEQREKAAEALKSFLTFSLIGSLALHIGVLSSIKGNLSNTSKVEIVAMVLLQQDKEVVK